MTISNKIITLEPDIDVTINPSARARRVIVRIKGDKVILTIPKRSSEAQAIQFLKSKIDWVKANLKKQKKIEFAHESRITIFGQEYTITNSSERSRGIVLEGDLLKIYGKPINLDIRIKKFLHLLLKHKLKTLIAEMCNQLKVTCNKISIKEMNSRWGSCSSEGNLAFSFKLVFADIEAVKYVVAHEVSHLKEMNHSPKFWAHVESLYPDWQKQRKWLKDNGKFVL
jgi:predicted metal-dependent hydrolase